MASAASSTMAASRSTPTSSSVQSDRSRSTARTRLFAGSDEGGANWAIIASLIETAKLNAVNPQAWLTDTLTKLVNRWPASRIDDLMPWAYAKIGA